MRPDVVVTGRSSEVLAGAVSGLWGFAHQVLLLSDWTQRRPRGLSSGKSRLAKAAPAGTPEKGRRPAPGWGRGAGGPGARWIAYGALWPARQFTGNPCACRSRRCPLWDNPVLRESRCSRTRAGASPLLAGRAGDWLARLGSWRSTPGGSTDSVPAETAGAGGSGGRRRRGGAEKAGEGGEGEREEEGQGAARQHGGGCSSVAAT